MLKSAIWVAILAVVGYQIIYPLCYIGIEFTKAAAGPYGMTLRVTDIVGEKFPRFFTILQGIVQFPIPNHAAKEYFESQREFFLEAARNFELHPYWSTQNAAAPTMSFREVTTERIRAMYRQYEQTGRMDYRLEKDRCAQFEFFRNNRIPHPKIQRMWHSLEGILDEVESGAAVETMEHWPIFFKACHLTQRSSLGTFPLSSKKDFEEKKPELVQWINDKWVYRSRDVDRPWQKEGDAITDALTPGFIVQEPMIETGGDKAPRAGFKIDGRVAVGLVELKVEVFWGKVYIMQMDATNIFLRNGEIEDYGDFINAIFHRPSKASSRVTWIRDEGYLDCVVELAERVARAAHIEYIRVDIFLDRGDPNNCAVNEVSLSSGYSYYGHEEFMANIWAGPLQSKAYKVFNSDTPVYELVSTEE